MSKPRYRCLPSSVTEGNLYVSILTYSVPIMLTYLISTLFNAADLIVIGQFASIDIISSVGLCGPIVSLLVSSFLSIAGGTNAVIARFIGAKKSEEIKRSVSTSMLFALISGLVLAAIAIPLAETFLRLISCPEANLPHAGLYLTIYFAGIPSMMVYNFGSAVLRADGDSSRPLVYLIACGILNIGLNFTLCCLMERKIAAVAVATVVSQTLGAVLVTVRLFRAKGDCSLRPRALVWDNRILFTILRFGIPCFISACMYSIANLQVQAGVNGFDDAVIAGYTAAGSLEGIVDSLVNAFGVSTLVFVGQNFGAGDIRRVRKTVRISMLYNVGGTLLLGFGIYALAHPLLSVYLPGQEEAILAGIERIRMICLPYFAIAIYYTLTRAMAALGYSSLPAIMMVVSIFGLRTVWVNFIFPAHPTLTMLLWCYPLSFLLNLVIQVVLFIFVRQRLLHGKIKTV